MRSRAHAALQHDWDRGPDGLHRLRHPTLGPLVIKRRGETPPGFFPAEARGLRALADAGGLRTPRVLAVSEQGIALEDLGEGRPGRQHWIAAGEALARQHACRGPAFGFAAEGFIGDSVQSQSWEQDGHRFFAEQRLLPQARRAYDGGRLEAAVLKDIEGLCRTLRSRLPEAPPVLVHGDLWTGNLHPCASGELALIDAGAAHYGWGAAGLAMLVLFGAPPGDFFDAYEAQAHPGPWRAQVEVLNLYHLLNHLNLFGAGYLAPVKQIARRNA